MLPSLPENILPKCWNDEIRMSVLFAPIRPRSVNAQDWDTKYKFWKSLISSYCSECGVVAFNLSDLRKVFKKGSRFPSCFDVVVEEMVKTGECSTLHDFMQKRSDTWSKWAVNILIKKPMVWSYNLIKNSVSTPQEICFVHIGAIEKESQKLLSFVPNECKNKIITLEELLEISGCSHKKVDDVRILLHYLVDQYKVDVKEHESKEWTNLNHILIKIFDLNKVKPITDVDVGIHTLEENEKLLIKNVEKLENDVSKILEEARIHLSQGRRQMAKSCLRKKHEIEKCLTKRVNALHNVQILLSRIKHAETDAEVFNSYNLALNSLKDTFKNAGLTEEAVSHTMLELGEVLEIHDDIQASLAQPVTGESDVEEELAELLASDIKEPPREPPSDADIVDLQNRLENLVLPDAPKTKITSPQSKVSL